DRLTRRYSINSFARIYELVHIIASLAGSCMMGAPRSLPTRRPLQPAKPDASSLLLRLADRCGDVRHHGDRRQCADGVLAVLSADHFRVRMGARRHRRGLLLRLLGSGWRQSAV